MFCVIYLIANLKPHVTLLRGANNRKSNPRSFSVFALGIFLTAFYHSPSLENEKGLSMMAQIL